MSAPSEPLEIFSRHSVSRDSSKRRVSASSIAKISPFGPSRENLLSNASSPTVVFLAHWKVSSNSGRILTRRKSDGPRITITTLVPELLDSLIRTANGPCRPLTSKPHQAQPRISNSCKPQDAAVACQARRRLYFWKLLQAAWPPF